MNGGWWWVRNDKNCSFNQVKQMKTETTTRFSPCSEGKEFETDEEAANS